MQNELCQSYEFEVDFWIQVMEGSLIQWHFLGIFHCMYREIRRYLYAFELFKKNLKLFISFSVIFLFNVLRCINPYTDAPTNTFYRYSLLCSITKAALIGKPSFVPKEKCWWKRLNGVVCSLWIQFSSQI